MSQDFLEKIKSYLDERLRNEVPGGLPFKPFKIDVTRNPSDWWRWRVLAETVVRVGVIEEYKDGMIAIWSCGLDAAGDYIGECLVKSYRHKFDKAKGNKEEEKKIWEVLRKVEKNAREDYINRRNLERHLRKPYWRTFIRLLWFDEVARKVSKEYETEIFVGIDSISCETGLGSKFDSSNMNDEEKLREIKKRVEAIVRAYKLCEIAYETRWPKECRKEYLEFCETVLARYGINRKRGL